MIVLCFMMYHHKVKFLIVIFFPNYFTDILCES